MSSDERVSVQTYVPESQRNRWRTDAEALDMSQAEFVRTMVQAGRRGFELYTDGDDLNTDGENTDQAGLGDATPGVGGLKERVLDVLRESEFADWDTLLAGVTDDIEERLEETLDELQANDRIRYSGRHGGYTVVDDER
ncbi:hypothetical protein KM295_07635 [Natronomonas sp. F2-12]|jgi:hypothetical protein|uniref:Uncharacterized protein n=1 Tax=Natronomonas aquatica TaxID=2841590 RepID=A0A9R1CTG7_9EURY|nr:DUF5805 domain-containing protein [Natronomonas aquatica]MCQ4333351.1 hypothetical protein [Natronomonas aquatica]